MSTADIASEVTAPQPPRPGRNRNLLLAGGGLVAATACLALLLARLQSASPPPAAPEAVRSTPYLEGDFIRYSQAFAEREKVSYAVVGSELLTPTIHLTGKVTWDARRVAAVGARIEGRIRSVLKVAGESVQAGETMAELESVELGKAQAEVLKARAREQVALTDMERERRLADSKIAPERDAQHARAAAEAATAERLAAEKAVEAMGGTVGGEVGVLKLKSPMAGRVVEMEVRRGETVEPQDTLFVVADLSRVWVELTVYERELVAIREGDEVELRVPADMARVYRGRVAHVSEVIDPDKHSGHVRVEVDNPEGLLRPGLSVVAQVHASGPRGTSLVVPRQAVTRVDGKPTVFVAVEEGKVEPRPVELGAADADSVAVSKGLAAGERVVVGGVLALKAEIFR